MSIAARGAHRGDGGLVAVDQESSPQTGGSVYAGFFVDRLVAPIYFRGWLRRRPVEPGPTLQVVVAQFPDSQSMNNWTSLWAAGLEYVGCGVGDSAGVWSHDGEDKGRLVCSPRSDEGYVFVWTFDDEEDRLLRDMAADRVGECRDDRRRLLITPWRRCFQGQRGRQSGDREVSGGRRADIAILFRERRGHTIASRRLAQLHRRACLPIIPGFRPHRLCPEVEREDLAAERPAIGIPQTRAEVCA